MSRIILDDVSDATMSGPVRLTVEAEVRVADPTRVGGSEAQRAEFLEGLIRRHAWIAGLEVLDPQSVRVRVTRPV